VSTAPCARILWNLSRQSLTLDPQNVHVRDMDRRHVIPNCLVPVIVLAAVNIGVAIVVAASLGFLGLGPSETVMDWGALIASGENYIDKDWWISIFPGLTVTLLVIAVSIVGDRLRDRMEPAGG